MIPNVGAFFLFLCAIWYLSGNFGQLLRQQPHSLDVNHCIFCTATLNRLIISYHTSRDAVAIIFMQQSLNSGCLDSNTAPGVQVCDVKEPPVLVLAVNKAQRKEAVVHRCYSK